METQDQGDRRPLWTDTQLKQYEARLLDERKVAIAQMQQFDKDIGTSQTEADGELNSWKFHMADEGTDTYDQEQSLLFASREGRLLWHIDEALRRIYKTPESYGRCEECAGEIGEDRLDALPYATRCIDCKQDWEGGRAG